MELQAGKHDIGRFSSAHFKYLLPVYSHWLFYVSNCNLTLIIMAYGKTLCSHLPEHSPSFESLALKFVRKLQREMKHYQKLH